MATDFKKPAFSIAEFCTATSLGRSWVYEEIRRGRLKVLKAGRRTLITSEEMTAWMQRLAAEAEGA